MSIDFFTPIIDLLSRFWNCAVPQVDSIHKLEENRDALTTAMIELKALRDDTVRTVRVAEQRPDMKRTEQVENWLSRVQEIEDKVEKLIRDASREIEKKCLGGCCPQNCKASFQLGKEVVQKLKEVADLTQSRAKFEEVAGEQPLPLVVGRPIEPTVGLESTFDEVWSCINEDEQAGIIGLFGPGGVGKTTLLTQINNKFYNTPHNFDVVIWAVVSSNPNFTKVQEDIGKRIGFLGNAWNGKSKEDKASDIFGVLSEKKFVLLLDDIWERFDLSEAGVPLPNEQNKSKVVFTTRVEDVCGKMKARKLIKMKTLSCEEAWDLFRENVGGDAINCDPEIQELAKEVAKECGGLPLALIITGRAMACKRNPQEWQDAITMLQSSAAKFSSLEDQVYNRLKFSYDNLSDDTFKACFLYCSLFPEDHIISRKELIEYWIGEGFLDTFVELREAQNRGQTIICTLIRACLLEEGFSLGPCLREEGSSRDYVKMHDVIRDTALWIARTCEEIKFKVLVEARVDLKKVPEVKKWKGVGRVSLMHNGIEELTEVPICPDLSTLFLNRNELTEIACGFFQSMPNLRVLDLSNNTWLSKLPKEISELVSLQYLNLSWTSIEELPIECKELVKLKYLNIERTSRYFVIPAGVLSSFKKLQVLKMLGSMLRVEDSEFERLVKEMECLKELKELTITLSTAFTFSRFLCCPNLPTFTTRLMLKPLKGSEYVDLCGLKSMRCLREFRTEYCADLKYLKAEEANLELCFHSLRTVAIFDCSRLKELNWLIFAPNLEHLYIAGCDGMEEVIRSEDAKEGGYPNPFAKLKVLRLRSSPRLKSIYPSALPFPCLYTLEIWGCPNLKKLPLNSDSARGCGLVIKGEEDWWNDLEWEDEATGNAFLSSFQSQKY